MRPQCLDAADAADFTFFIAYSTLQKAFAQRRQGTAGKAEGKLLSAGEELAIGFASGVFSRAITTVRRACLRLSDRAAAERRHRPQADVGQAARDADLDASADACR